MATVTAPPDTPGAPGRALRLRGREYPVVLPTVRDPRLHLAAVIVSLQVLGQTSLGFELSIAQILLSVATCAVLELAITFRRRRALVWPASAMLTGNGVAFILRVPGTEHGDWWSLRGWWIFVGVAAVSLLSKHLIRLRGRHLFNPSNLGLVLGFLLLGSRRADPQDLWWGPMSPTLVVVLAIIVVGGLVIVSREGMLGLSLAFWGTFAAGMTALAVGGHCMTARWHLGPVCGASLWTVLVTSPEILVFLFFMITDPRTTPAGRVARAVYGAGVGLLAALLVAPQRTEFATKVAVLAALTIVCAARPALERVLPAAGSESDRLARWLRTGATPDSRRARRPFVLGAVAVAAVAAVVAADLPSGPGPAEAPASAGAPFDVSRVDRRPAVDLAPGEVPPVAVADSVADYGASIDEPTATTIGRDVVEDLVVAAAAVAGGDVDLVPTVAVGTYRDAVERRSVTGATRSRPRVDAVTVVIVSDTSNAQALPQVGVEVHGTFGPLLDEPGPTTRTLALFYAGGHYLLAADLTDGS